MSGNVTYCASAFPEDYVFGIVIYAFFFCWKSSYIANPGYEPKDLLKVALHALASSECTEAPFF